MPVDKLKRPDPSLSSIARETPSLPARLGAAKTQVDRLTGPLWTAASALLPRSWENTRPVYNPRFPFRAGAPRASVEDAENTARLSDVLETPEQFQVVFGPPGETPLEPLRFTRDLSESDYRKIITRAAESEHGPQLCFRLDLGADQLAESAELRALSAALAASTPSERALCRVQLSVSLPADLRGALVIPAGVTELKLVAAAGTDTPLGARHLHDPMRGLLFEPLPFALAPARSLAPTLGRITLPKAVHQLELPAERWPEVETRAALRSLTLTGGALTALEIAGATALDSLTLDGNEVPHTLALPPIRALKLRNLKGSAPLERLQIDRQTTDLELDGIDLSRGHVPPGLHLLRCRLPRDAALRETFLSALGRHPPARFELAHRRPDAVTHLLPGAEQVRLELPRGAPIDHVQTWAEPLGSLLFKPIRFDLGTRHVELAGGTLCLPRLLAYAHLARPCSVQDLEDFDATFAHLDSLRLEGVCVSNDALNRILASPVPRLHLEGIAVGSMSQLALGGHTEHLYLSPAAATGLIFSARAPSRALRTLTIADCTNYGGIAIWLTHSPKLERLTVSPVPPGDPAAAAEFAALARLAHERKVPLHLIGEDEQEWIAIDPPHSGDHRLTDFA